MLRLPIKFRPPKAKDPFPLYFFRRSNRRPKQWDDAPPRAPPQPCLFFQDPSSRTPALSGLLFIPLKFQPPNAKLPFPLFFFRRSNRRPKGWDDVPPRAPPQPCLFYQNPPLRTPTLGWLLRLPMKFRPPKAMTPFPLSFFCRSNRRPKRSYYVPPRAPPRPCLLSQHPSS